MYNGALFNLMPAGDGKVDIFTLAKSFGEPPAGAPSMAVNPDVRSWGSMNLWQNQRLPYVSMPARGESDFLPVLFRYYRRFWDLNRVRAKVYYGAEGQYNTEITQSFGLQPGDVYGYDRKGLKTGYSANRWGGAVDISPGLELVQLMLDYYEYTGDSKFLEEEILPYSADLLKYIATRFRERRGGKIVIAPLQAVETYWDTTDPVTVTAGMRAVLGRILALPAASLKNRAFFEGIERMAPEIAMEDAEGRKVIAPARQYSAERHNVEAPAFYAVWPFRLYGLEKPDLELAIASYRWGAKVAKSFQPFQIGWRPDTPSYSGWQQHGMVTALLGLRDDAREVVVNNSKLNNPGNRFPVMWGPVYDAVPDVDHGANLLNTLQLMAFQAEGDRLLVLPAWPKQWDVSFLLHGPRGTKVRCEYRGGKVEKLEVTPAGRGRGMKVMM